MGRRYRDIHRQLLHKFHFQEPIKHNPDHEWVELQLDGLPPIRTKVSFGSGEADPNLEAIIAKQLRVHGPFFRDMIDCRASCEDYYQKLRTDPYPPFR